MTEENADKWRTISQLFNDIVDLDPRQRAERLSKIGEEDSRVRRAVESLLAADAVADERLSRYDTGISDVMRTSAIAPPADSVDPLAITGKTFSHFRIKSFVASGGMGVVYEAVDTQLNRPVALKFPLPHHRLGDRGKERFIREARAAGALDHVNLCPVYEIGESEYGLFLAMPFYRGTTLKQLLVPGRRLPIAQTLDIARQIAAGLTHAHAAGVIHRDLKPGNVVLLADGTVKILDFGLARTQDLTQTKSEVTLGTVSYMAPEQIRGSRVDERADLWSLGVILYEMVTGERPFTGDHEATIAHAILNKDPTEPGALQVDVPTPVWNLILALLQKDPRVRYPRAQALLADIENVERGTSPSFKPAVGVRVIAWVHRRRIPVAISCAVALTLVAAATVPRLTSRMNRPTDNAEAYDFYQRARDYERHGPMAAAESLYLRAVALDSVFALARARLAIVYASCRAGGSRDCARRDDNPGRYRLEEIKTTAEAALRQQPQLAEAHFAMGLYWEQREEFASALAEFDHARKGMDRTGELHAALGRTYRARGKWDRAISELQRAIALDPADDETLVDLATTYSRLRRYAESARVWDRYLVRVPNAYAGMVIKGNVYLRWLGTVDTLAAIVAGLPPEFRRRSFTTRVLVARLQNRPNDAFAALDEAPRRPPEDTTALTFPPLLRAQVYVDLGDSSRARAYFDTARVQLEKLTALRPKGARAQAALGLAYAGLGLHAAAKRAADSAMVLEPLSRSVVLGTTLMREAAEIFAQIPADQGLAIALLDSLLGMPAGREASVPLLRVEPEWKPLRNDPRFQALLSRYTPR